MRLFATMTMTTATATDISPLLPARQKVRTLPLDSDFERACEKMDL